MSSRSLLNLALLLGAVALGLVAWLQPGKTPPKPAVTVTSLKPADVTRIELKRAERPDMTFEKRGQQWYIVGKHDLRAAQFAVAGLLRLADQKVSHSYPLSKMDAAQLKLDKPQASVRFNKGPLIQFGTTSAIGGDRYLKVGDHVYLVPDDYQPLVNGGVTTFVSRRLFPTGATVTGIDTPRFKLEQNSKGHWTLTPNNPDITSDAIQRFADGWAAASAITVQTYRGGNGHSGAHQPAVTVRLKGRKTPIHFVIVHRKPELVLARTDLGFAYHLGSEGTKRLLHIPAVHPEKGKTHAPETPAGAPAH
ncbi:MAG: DUF4340 domain-containing protein [Gammaproteobacteria bacterium]